MKKRMFLICLLTGLVMAVGLSGCIISVSPDTSQSVVMKPGETMEFKVVSVPQAACTWSLDAEVLSDTDNTYLYAPGSTDLGEHTLTVTLTAGESHTWKILVEQDIPVTWEKTWGGTGDDYAYSIQPTSDSGYIVAGVYHEWSEYWKSYVAKLDEFGNIKWQKYFNDSGTAYAIQQTSDGGYILAGYNSLDTCLANYIMKLDAYGSIMWQKSFGEDIKASGSSSGFNSIQQTEDGGYIAAGYAEFENIPGVIFHGARDYYVVKLDYLGNLEWQMMYGGSSWDEATFIQQTMDGAYIVAGSSNSKDIEGGVGYGGYWIIKLNTSGGVEWQKMYYQGQDNKSSMRQTSDGGYIVASRREGIIKLDHSGNEEWHKAFTGDNADYDVKCVQLTTDGGYIIAGYRWGKTTVNGYLLKLDGSGSKDWEKVYGNNKFSELQDVRQTRDGGYIAAGYRNAGLYIYYPVIHDPEDGRPHLEFDFIYFGNRDDLFVLKVSPDGEMN
jgi:hypothetical protein